MDTIAKEILSKINKSGYDAYIVGGYVRDLLLGKKSVDIDICTNATANILTSLFNGKVNDYGSINMKINKFNIDITTFRIEKDYENGKPKQITFISNLKTDLKRRDFTINTICMDKKGKTIDYLDGVEDLNNKIIRSVEEPLIKLQEDPLRILRAIRLATVLDFRLDESLNCAIIQLGYLVKCLSTYRIKEEIAKILLSVNYKKGLDLIKKYHIDKYLNLSFKNIVYTSNLYGMWAQIENIDDFPFTNKEKNTIVKLREILEIGFINYEILYKYGLELSLIAGEVLELDSIMIQKMYKDMSIKKRSDLKISYMEIADLLKMKPSKELKEVEKDLVQEVLQKRLINLNDAIKKFLINNKERWK